MPSLVDRWCCRTHALLNLFRKRRGSGLLDLISLKSMDAATVAGSVLAMWRALGKTGKPQPHESTVLAGFTISHADDPAAPPTVIAIGTGTKCLGGSKRCPQGSLVHDCHAEVIARRALLTWIHSEVLLALSLATQEHEKEIAAQMPASSHPRPDQQNQPQQPKQQAAFSYNPTIHKLRLKPGLQLHMFVSQPPCGDASIITHAEGEAGQALERASANEAAGCAILYPPESKPSVATAAGHPDSVASVIAAQQKEATHSCVADAQPPLPHSRSTQGAGTDASNASTHAAFSVRTGAKALRLSAPLRECGSDDGGDLGEVSCGGVSIVSVGQQQVNGSQQQQPEEQHACQGTALPQAGDVEEGPQQLGCCRRKPGKGDATLSLSCSDKLARWSCLGLQGCLLSAILEEPLYLSSLVVALPPNLEAAGPAGTQAAERALHRAVAGRLQGHVECCLQEPFRCQPPDVHITPPCPEDLGLVPSEIRKASSGTSIGWCALPGRFPFRPGTPRPGLGVLEVILGADGFKAGASKAKARAGLANSRLSRAALFKQWSETCAMLSRLGNVGDTQQASVVSANDCVQPGTTQQAEEGCPQLPCASEAEGQCVEADGAQAQQQCSEPSSIASESWSEEYARCKRDTGRAYSSAWSRLRQHHSSPFVVWITKPFMS